MDDRMMMPTDELLIDLADLYKVFGDYSRIRILYLLMQEAVKHPGIRFEPEPMPWHFIK